VRGVISVEEGGEGGGVCVEKGRALGGDKDAGVARCRVAKELGRGSDHELGIEASGDEGEAHGDKDETAEKGLVMDVDVREKGRAPGSVSGKPKRDCRTGCSQVVANANDFADADRLGHEFVDLRRHAVHLIWAFIFRLVCVAVSKQVGGNDTEAGLRKGLDLVVPDVA
jgi:hypothetical protein